MGHRYEFAEFVLDPREGLLLRSNEPVKATPRLLALLEALVDRPGRLVEKKELLDRVWEGTSVSEANLTVQVSKLRRLLDETETRVFIETVPTRGYRFLVPVRVVTPEAPVAERPPAPMTEDALASPFFLPPAVAPPAIDTRTLVRRPVRWRKWVLAAAIVVLIAWLVAAGRDRYLASRLAREGDAGAAVGAGAKATPDATSRLTSNVADDAEPAVSPDGRTVAFVSNRDGVPAIYLLPLDRRDAPPVRVRTKGPARAPSWSPDGARLAFVCQRDGQADVCLVGRDGSDERVLVSQPQDEVDPVWSPDGRRLAYSLVSGRTWELHVVDVDSARARLVGPPGWSAQSPAWSPDGSRLAVSRWRTAEDYDIWIVPLDGSSPTPVVESAGSKFDPAWSPDGSHLAYASGHGLVVVDVGDEGGDRNRVDRRARIAGRAGRRDGRSLVFDSGRDGNAELYLVPVPQSGSTDEAQRLTDVTAADKDPAWSPDGTRIAFASNRDGKYELYVMRADGGALERLTRNDDNDERPSWSPDGRKLAFMREHARVHDIYTIDLATRREQLLTPEPGSDSEPAWSPDGTRIAFNSSRSGNFEIYVMQADGSRQVAITDDPARDTYPAWSPDGREIVFASNKATTHFYDNDLFITSAEGTSPPRRLTHTAAWDAFPAWSRDGRWIAFVRSISEHHDIMMVDVATGIERPLTRESADEDQPTWSPDGRRIAYFANPSGNADIYVRAVK